MVHSHGITLLSLLKLMILLSFSALWFTAMEPKNPTSLHEQSLLFEDQKWFYAAWSHTALSTATTSGEDNKVTKVGKSRWDQPIDHSTIEDLLPSKHHHVQKQWTALWALQMPFPSRDEMSSVPVTIPAILPCSGEEQATMMAILALKNGLSALSTFFLKKDEPYHKTEEEFDDEEEVYDYKDVVNSKHFTFFKDMFDEDKDLRACYRDKWDKGHVIPASAEQTGKPSDKVDANENASEWRNYSSKARGKRWNTWNSKDYKGEQESKVRRRDYIWR